MLRCKISVIKPNQQDSAENLQPASFEQSVFKWYTLELWLYKSRVGSAPQSRLCNGVSDCGCGNWLWLSAILF